MSSSNNITATENYADAAVAGVSSALTSEIERATAAEAENETRTSQLALQHVADVRMLRAQYSGVLSEMRERTADIAGRMTAVEARCDDTFVAAQQAETDAGVAKTKADAAVLVTEQTLTDQQKAQARANIGAIASAPVASVNGQTGAVVLAGDNINYAPGKTINAQINTIGGWAEDAIIVAQSASGEIDDHKQDHNNPHNVTAAQIGAASDFEVQRKVSKTTIEALGEDYTMDELKDKINTIIRALMACAVVCFGLFAFGDTVDTARLGSLKSSAMVVTNVHFTAYQPILTAGENITISNNVISAGGGSVAPTGFENQTNTISYPTIAGNAVNLAITDAGVLSVNSNGWTDGQSVFVTIRPAGSYTVQGINLIGYGTFPANASQCVVWKVGTAFYLSVISAL